jgi:hypothetical protein
VKIKILKLKSLHCETCYCDYLSDCLTENGSVGKVVGLCADNVNSNFGGVQSEGQNKLHIKLGHGVIGVGCAGHIFYYTV